jgi:hypothetical protein
MHLSRGTPALFIPGFQRAQWHKKAGVGAGRDSPNGTVIMTLEQPKKKPELLISLVCVFVHGVRLRADLHIIYSRSSLIN